MFVEQYVGRKGDFITFEDAVARQYDNVRLYVYMDKEDLLSDDYCYQMDARLAKLKFYNPHKTTFYLKLGKETYRLTEYSFWTAKGECINRETPYNREIAIVQDKFLNYGVLDLEMEKLLFTFDDSKHIDVISKDIFTVKNGDENAIIINRHGEVLDRLPFGEYTFAPNGIVRSDFSTRNSVKLISYDELEELNRKAEETGLNFGFKVINVKKESYAGKTLR